MCNLFALPYLGMGITLLGVHHAQKTGLSSTIKTKGNFLTTLISNERKSFVDLQSQISAQQMCKS